MNSSSQQSSVREKIIQAVGFCPKGNKILLKINYFLPSSLVQSLQITHTNHTAYRIAYSRRISSILRYSYFLK